MDTSLVAVIDAKIEGLFRSEAKEDVVIELNTMKFMENLYLKSNKHKRCFLFLENDTIYVYYWKDNVTDVTDVYVFGFGLELKGHKKDCFSKFCDIVSTQNVIFDNNIISKIYDRYNAIIPFDKNWCKKNPLRLLHYLAAQFGKEEDELFYNCGLFDIAFYFHRYRRNQSLSNNSFRIFRWSKYACVTLS